MAEKRTSRKQAALAAIQQNEKLKDKVRERNPQLFKISTQLDRFTAYQTRNGTKIVVTLFEWALPKGDWSYCGKIERYHVFFNN
jgi:hypothetical protein